MLKKINKIYMFKQAFTKKVSRRNDAAGNSVFSNSSRDDKEGKQSLIVVAQTDHHLGLILRRVPAETAELSIFVLTPPKNNCKILMIKALYFPCLNLKLNFRSHHLTTGQENSYSGAYG